MTWKTSLFVLLIAAVVAMPAAAAAVIGQTALNSARVDGALVPAGTTLLSPTTIATGDYPATVHLATGQTLNLGPNSSARLAAFGDGQISLAAESGNVEVGTEGGQTFKLASNAIAVLDDDDPSTGSGDRSFTVCDADGNLITWDGEGKCLGCSFPNEDGECEKGRGAGFFIVVGAAAAGAGYVLGHEGDETITRTEQVIILCGVPDASGVVPPGTNPPGVGGCP